jgi:outer membrane protein OmpA-like peptidoglycan-associated protein/tetratricopeptide (TPR) repeat protein
MYTSLPCRQSETPASSFAYVRAFAYLCVCMRSGYSGIRKLFSSQVLWYLVGCLALSFDLRAQGSAAIKTANFPSGTIRAYYRGKYLDVVKAFENKEKEGVALSPEAKLYAASSFYALQDKAKAYALYREAFAECNPDQTDVRFVAEFGLLCLYAEDLRTAQRYLENALSRVRDADSIVYLSTALDWTKQMLGYKEPPPTDYVWKVYNFSRLNSPEMDYCVFRHGDALYFISRRDPKRGLAPEDLLPYEALYVSPLKDTSLLRMGFFGKFHEGIAGFLGKDTMVVYRSARRRGDFYLSTLSGSLWSEPVLWKVFPNSRKGSEDAICEDPKTGEIIFSSDRKGTQGGKDLWRTRRLPDGRFSTPEPITELNSPYDEDAPIILGDTLHFASNRPQSLGGYDVFRSIRREGRWSTPERLPKPFNSPGHDIYLFWLSPDSAFISSDRLGTLGKMDIYLIVKEPLPKEEPQAPAPPPRVYTFSGRVYNIRTQAPLTATIRLSTDPEAPPSWQSQSESAGTFSTPKPAGGTYFLIATAPGYAAYVESITLPDSTDFTYEIAMVPLDELRKIRFPRVHFDFDKYNLRTEAPKSLDTVLAILQQYPTLIVAVEGHTDSIGTDAYNLRLGQRRAETVRTFLIERGIAPHRLRPYSCGERKPWRPNDTPYNRFLNRRTEFRVLESAEPLPPQE